MKKKNGVDGDGAVAMSDLAMRFALLMSQVLAVASSDLAKRFALLISQVLAVATSDLATRFALLMSEVVAAAGANAFAVVFLSLVVDWDDGFGVL